MVVVPENEKREISDDKQSSRKGRKSRWKDKRNPSFVKVRERNDSGALHGIVGCSGLSYGKTTAVV